LVKHLAGLVLREIGLELRLTKDGAFAGLKVVTIDRAGSGETGESVERLLVLSFAAEPASALPIPGKLISPSGLPLSEKSFTWV
jgi:hypothetical protein